MNISEELVFEKKKYIIEANGGISLPAAGVVYWLALGVAGFYLEPNEWALLGFITSGLIFPLGMLLSKPLKANLMVKTPLSSLIFPAMVSMFLIWPIIIAGYLTSISLVPLFLAIGMSLHWPAIGWMYGSRVCLIHAIIRVGLVTIIWFALPDYRFTAIPILVSLIYLFTIWGLKQEVRKAASH